MIPVIPNDFKFTKKVLAYITQKNNLLVFKQPEFPDAGIQIPAGTIEFDEEPEEALKREIVEETGLTNLKVIQKLGVYLFDMSPYRKEIQERHVYHVELEETTPITWQHFETSGGKNSIPIAFEFFWASIELPIDLEKDQGKFLPELLYMSDTTRLPHSRE